MSRDDGRRDSHDRHKDSEPDNSVDEHVDDVSAYDSPSTARGDVVSVGEVSEEVRKELARLFGSADTAVEPQADLDPTPLNVTAEISVEVEELDIAVDAEGAMSVEIDDTVRVTEVSGSLPAGSASQSDQQDPARVDQRDGESRVQRFARRRRERREVVPIGDPNFDSIAPLPIDGEVLGGELRSGHRTPDNLDVDTVAAGNVIEIVDDFTHPDLQDASSVSRVVTIDDERGGSRTETRERRRQRRRKLRQVKWFRVAGFIVGGFIVVTAILSSPLFAIRRVTFEGNVYTAPETVTKVRDLLEGASIFTVDTALARRTLLDDPWVADVRITTDFPGGALVEVSERDPVVWYVGEDQKARVVDDRGHVIAVLDGWPTKYLQVKGTGPSVEAGATTDDVYRAAAQLVLALPAEIKGKVASLELSAGGELSMELKGGTVVRFGPPEGLQDKLVAVVVLLRRQDPATLAVVDVSTGEATVQTR